MADIIVIDLLPLDYDPVSYLRRPLGGTQSAVLDTCVRLAENADIALYNGVSHPSQHRRLTVAPNTQITLAELARAKWIVFVSWVTETGLRELPLSSGGHPRVALWAHHDIDQPAVAFLNDAAMAGRLSKLLFVSRWQRDRYQRRFPVTRIPAAVIGNPYCERALAQADPVDKTFDRPLLIYSSTPFRGLDTLVDAFPLFRRAHPDAELTVLSGMELYGSNDNAPYHALFDKIARTAGVRLSKPQGKIDLYRHLARANLFAYPSSFAETFCIAALEGQILGNALLLTRLGALPEIFPDAAYVEPIAGEQLSAEHWSEFMATEWNRTRSATAQRDLTVMKDRSRARYSPAAVAARFLHALENDEDNDGDLYMDRQAS